MCVLKAQVASQLVKPLKLSLEVCISKSEGSAVLLPINQLMHDYKCIYMYLYHSEAILTNQLVVFEGYNGCYFPCCENRLRSRLYHPIVAIVGIVRERVNASYYLCHV